MEKRICPKCNSSVNQNNFGFNRSGTQRCSCGVCGATYTLNPKTRAYPEVIRNIAIREYAAGISGRGVGKIHNMSHINVVNWIKKTKYNVDISTN